MCILLLFFGYANSLWHTGKLPTPKYFAVASCFHPPSSFVAHCSHSSHKLLCFKFYPSGIYLSRKPTISVLDTLVKAISGLSILAAFVLTRSIPTKPQCYYVDRWMFYGQKVDLMIGNSLFNYCHCMVRVHSCTLLHIWQASLHQHSACSFYRLLSILCTLSQSLHDPPLIRLSSLQQSLIGWGSCKWPSSSSRRHHLCSRMVIIVQGCNGLHLVSTRRWENGRPIYYIYTAFIYLLSVVSMKQQSTVNFQISAFQQ